MTANVVNQMQLLGYIVMLIISTRRHPTVPASLFIPPHHLDLWSQEASYQVPTLSTDLSLYRLSGEVLRKSQQPSVSSLEGLVTTRTVEGLPAACVHQWSQFRQASD